MKHTIVIVFLFFLFGYVQSQEKIVFKLDSTITEKDRILFKEKSKYQINDFYQEDKIIVEEDKESNAFQITIDKPTVILLTLSPDVQIFQEIYLNRSDTITISKRFSEELNGSYLFLEGKNDFTSPQYNFHSIYEIWQKENPSVLYKKGTDLNLYKEAAKEWIRKKKVFTNDYLKKEKALLEFADFLDNRLECEYTFKLLVAQFSVTDYPDNYMDGRIVGDYNSRFFVAGSDLYIRWYKDIEKYSFTQMLEFINSNFEGDEQEYLLSLAFGKYSDGEKIDGAEYIRLAEEYEKKIENKHYLNYLRGVKDYFYNSLSALPDNVKENTKLMSFDLQETDLKTILEKNKGKYFILDFWASWCGPCIIDIKASGEMKSFLASNDIVQIYLSQDIHLDKWKAMAIKLGIEENQYMLSDIENSPLLNFFKIVTIPRYIYLDKDLSVISWGGKAPTEDNREYVKEIFNLK